MNRIIWITLAWLCIAGVASAQTLSLSNGLQAEDPATADTVRALAKTAIPRITPNSDLEREAIFFMQIAAEAYDDAAKTLSSLTSPQTVRRLLPYDVYTRAQVSRAHAPALTFEEAYRRVFLEAFASLDDATALDQQWFFGTLPARLRDDFQRSLDRHAQSTELTLAAVGDLTRRYAAYVTYRTAQPLSDALIAEDDTRRYAIDENVLIKTRSGATLSAVIARGKAVAGRLPAAVFWTIYTDVARSRHQAKVGAAHGYVGITVDTRGKRLSPDEIVPFENEVKDTPEVIDWIARQPWSDGQVGMYGGSYTGMVQWSATKHLHPALKTIVPYVAAIHGLGLPMENNVFLNANYGWSFYVTNNKYLDEKTYADRQRWQSLNQRWYASGRPYREIDQVDGTPNRFLQRWLEHPAFDAYWQALTPYKEDYARIDIPVLSITGYYDDGQISALHYFSEHYKYNPKANHHLLIGPYDHFGAQSRRKETALRDYTIDPVAQFDTEQITFQWFDHIMRGGPKPALLKDKVNYEVMGANTWRHAPSLAQLNGEHVTFYLTDAKAGEHYRLATTKPTQAGALEQLVDYADRKTSSNDYYPAPIVGKKPDLSNGYSFISEPFEEVVSVDGTLEGVIRATINKRDMDIGVVLYEVMPDGRLFHLTYYLGRASYAEDMSVRKLLVPGEATAIPFERTRMVSRQLSKGSRLLVTLNINKNQHAQINYGTGRDVSDESIADAKEPLRVQWHNDSYVRVPVHKTR